MGLATLGYAAKEGLGGFDPALIGIFVAVGVAIFSFVNSRKNGNEGVPMSYRPRQKRLVFSLMKLNAIATLFRIGKTSNCFRAEAVC